MKMPHRFIAAFVVSIGTCATGAAASTCNISAQEIADPSLAAQRILRDANRVGFAVITSKQDIEAGRAEEIDIVEPLKGRGGLVRLKQAKKSDSSVEIVGGAETTFNLPEGNMVFAVLYGSEPNLTIIGCTNALLEQGRRADIIRAAIKQSRR